MQGMLENVRRTALKTKIRGEMALLDRQIYLLMCQFGVDYYDAAVSAFGVQHRRYPIPSAIADAFDRCRDDIQVKLNEKNAKDTLLSIRNGRRRCPTNHHPTDRLRRHRRGSGPDNG
jgi:hypothetical protein